MTTSNEQRVKSIAALREILNSGDTVFTILRHASSSGMTWHVSVIVGECRDITHYVAHALDMRRSGKTGGIVVSGYGSDVGFDLVYDLKRVLWPEDATAVLDHRRL